MKNETNYLGKELGFRYWVGVVEDRRDPKKLGRLRTRILGIHTEIKKLIPTCKLHWASIIQPVTWNQAMNGLGHSPTGPAEGTWVFGFFMDGPSSQDPVIFGTLTGIPEEPPKPCIGFYDPSKPFHEIDASPRKIRIRHYPNDGTGAQNVNESISSLYPRETHPWGCVLNEPDINRLCRVENVDDTIIGVRRRQRSVKVPIAPVHSKPSRQWNEPLPGYNSKYPYNHTFESESGHIIEIDDTKNAERLHIWHRSGTYIEIGTGNEEDPGLHGNLSIKCVGKRFEVTMENSYSEYQNTCNVTVRGETNIYCQSNANVQVDGNLTVDVGGDYHERIHGDYISEVDGNRTIKIGKNLTENVIENKLVKVGMALTENALETITLESAVAIVGNAPITWSPALGMGNPLPPVPPVVPPFPSALNRWTEGRFESGNEPQREVQADPNPVICPQQEDC